MPEPEPSQCEAPVHGRCGDNSHTRGHEEQEAGLRHRQAPGHLLHRWRVHGSSVAQRLRLLACASVRAMRSSSFTLEHLRQRPMGGSHKQPVEATGQGDPGEGDGDDDADAEGDDESAWSWTPARARGGASLSSCCLSSRRGRVWPSFRSRSSGSITSPHPSSCAASCLSPRLTRARAVSSLQPSSSATSR